jgi:hypothetical protein
MPAPNLNSRPDKPHSDVQTPIMMQVVLGSRIVVCAGSAAFASACVLQDYFLQLRSFGLRSRMLENQLGIKRIYCELALALLEGTDDGPFVDG